MKEQIKARIGRDYADLSEEETDDIGNVVSSKAHQFYGRIIYIGEGDEVMRTNTNLIGQVPLKTALGDVIFTGFGAPVLFVLRPTRDSYRLIGQYYIHGLMKGEDLIMKRFNHIQSESSSPVFSLVQLSSMRTVYLTA